MYIPQGVYETLRFCSGVTHGVSKSDSEFDWLISNLRRKVWHFASANPPPTQTFLEVRHAVLPQVNERVGIWLVELYERIGKSIILVGRKTQNSYKQMHFMAVKKSRKRSGFVISSYFEDSAFTVVKRDAKLQPRYVKGVICISSANVANRTYRKGVSFLSTGQKWYIKG